MKNYSLVFEDSHDNTREISKINDFDKQGHPKSAQDILDDACLLIGAFCAERNFRVYYTRISNCDGSTIFDVGSHTKLFYLTPAVNFCGDAVASERTTQNG